MTRTASGPVTVLLDRRQTYTAMAWGARRLLTSLHRTDRAPGMDGWLSHQIGACGEAAVRVALQLEAPLTVDAFGQPDFVTPGGTPLEVRTQRPESQRRVKVRPHDPDDWAVVACRMEGFRREGLQLSIPGWCYAGEAKQARWWDDPGHMGGAYFVPYDELRPLATMP